MDKPQIVNRLPNPRKNANMFSVAVFGYVVPVFIKGMKKAFEEEDMYEHLDDHASKTLGNRLEEAWRKELTHRQPSLWRALRKVFWIECVVQGFVYLLVEIVIKVSQSLALFQLMEYFTQTEQKISKKGACAYANIIVLSSFLYVIIGHNLMLNLQHFGMKIRVACCSLIYKKSLRLNKAALGGTTIGQMVNLLSKDVSRCERFVIYMHILWVCPIQIIIVVVLLYLLTGLTSTVGILFMVLSVPFQMFLGKQTSVFRLKTALKTDERILLMNEIISGIKVIKMYTWEKPFAKLVSTVRRLEIDNVRAASYIQAVMVSLVVFTTRFSIFLTVLVYVALGNTLEAQYIFVVISFYNVLKHMMVTQFTHGVRDMAEIKVCMSRLQKFMLYDETETEENEFLSFHSNTKKESLNNVSYEKYLYNSSLNIGVHLRHVSAKWSPECIDYTLNDIDFVAQAGQLVIVIGPVGCGKSSLLNAILKELPLEAGSLIINGEVSYASQEAWIFAGSIQQNILFGQSMDLKRYEEVIRVCALEQDFILFPYGDKTLVGEKGAMLSGGQRARVNLARAVYKRADIYLLDDPLSAVDIHVSKQLFESCICTFLKNKCIVLVTHQLQYLKNADRIFLFENGELIFGGIYQELNKLNVEFIEQLNENKEAEILSDGELEKTISRRSTMGSEVSVQLKEDKTIRNISKHVYMSYFQAGGSLLTASGILTLLILKQITASGADYFLTVWVNSEENQFQKTLDIMFRGRYYALTRGICIYIYTTIVILMIILTLTGTFLFYRYCIQASTKLHDNMFSNIVHATMNFFNLHSCRRILNRFVKDMGAIDELLPTVAFDCIEIALNVIGVIIVVAILKPWSLAVTAIIAVMFYFLRILYVSTSRSLKRLEAINRSSVFGHMNTTLQGLTTIRAYGAQIILEKKFDDLQDSHSSVWFLFISCTRAFGFWLDFICVFYIAAATFSCFTSKPDEQGGNVGLAITQTISLTGILQWGMRQWSELENNMISVERVVEYITVERELERRKIVPPPTWPEKGTIKFRLVSLRYLPGDPYALKNLSFTVKSREKVGIVGRTGAGKSSLIYSLFQLAEIEGAIFIDYINITKVSLQRLRSRISIIPQGTVLFTGTLRKNLDPFEEYSDTDLWKALTEVELKTVIDDLPGGLNATMSERGSNFSVGQRQLICLARAIIRNNKILILDEATSNIDHQTNTLIQNTIRSKFSNCTVLTIARRLHTIMDSHKVLVMKDGQVHEFDHPYLLLQDEGSLFYSMVQGTGEATAEDLRKIAEESYKKIMES